MAQTSLITIPLPEHAPFNILEGDRKVSVSVCDSVLSFKAEALAFSTFTEVWVWDWKTGEVLLVRLALLRAVRFADPTITESVRRS